MRADELLAKGDQDGAATWRRVIKATDGAVSQAEYTTRVSQPGGKAREARSTGYGLTPSRFKPAIPNLLPGRKFKNFR